ncbi:hypothetical protein ACFVYG_32690 [Streptomyces sp. NPDC058256]|uniref:hypothetical protein n=1 Tax=Streptomyces sp. NPDC058256 TaxID=3346408 RepID=UPI0036F19406
MLRAVNALQPATAQEVAEHTGLPQAETQWLLDMAASEELVPSVAGKYTSRRPQAR